MKRHKACEKGLRLQSFTRDFEGARVTLCGVGECFIEPGVSFPATGQSDSAGLEKQRENDGHLNPECHLNRLSHRVFTNIQY